MQKLSSTLPANSKVAQTAQIREIGILTCALLDAEDALEQERAAHAATRAEMVQYETAMAHYAQMLQSTSWRVTAPMRWVVTKLRRT